MYLVPLIHVFRFEYGFYYLILKKNSLRIEDLYIIILLL